MNNAAAAERKARYYRVDVKGQPSRLINAYSPFHAMRFAYQITSVTVASQGDLVAMLRDDPVDIEDATNPEGERLAHSEDAGE